MSSLVIAGHGTRLPEGQETCRALVERVRQMLPDRKVYDCYVELTEPPIGDTVAKALLEAPDKHVVVVPLMIGSASHVRDDIPEGIREGQAKAGGGSVSYAGHLGPDPLLRAAARERITEARGQWSAEETSVVFLGRGCSVPQANADHVRLGRLLLEEGGYGDVVTGFIQVSQPNLSQALDRAYAHGGRKIVVMPHYLFPGLLQKWAIEQTEAWQRNHPDAEVRVSKIIGDCDGLAQMVIDRFRCFDEDPSAPDAVPEVYLSGLVLTGRKVTVAGAGRVASRRIGKLLEAGAVVQVIAPEADQRVSELAESGQLSWQRREVTESDLDDAWYVLALTDNAQVNEQVAAWAQHRHIFCVRSDKASGGTAWTPATGKVSQMRIGVVGGHPHRTAHARTMAVNALAGVDDK